MDYPVGDSHKVIIWLENTGVLPMAKQGKVMKHINKQLVLDYNLQQEMSHLQFLHLLYHLSGRWWTHILRPGYIIHE